jgi:hypothetical protein
VESLRSIIFIICSGASLPERQAGTVSKTNLSINFTEDKLQNPEIPQFLNPKTDFLLDKLPYQHISM